ncbi:MAG TPA: hypothetical protein DCX27_08270, partial [Balneola sp.]|nr:hypothetical protein [Balneola sp.]
MSSQSGKPANPRSGTKTARVELHSLTGGKIRDITEFVSYVQIFSSLDSPFMEATVVVSDQDKIMADSMINGDVAVSFKAYAG